MHAAGSLGGWPSLNFMAARRHPEGPRFHQRDEGSPAQDFVYGRSLAPPEKRLRSG
ncbi:hypothetical protein SBA1_570019 [Candidatus Sulfotelmatobacter kueseliae]|uniref:Uncharacterized protein n=1 Tax=Candidatus Sulfotelmatobacter kueseliae TaxID=2042962 RepID=A0A2U3L0A3_9BACT|nr:hypothetical protein SBA1_570019 [Candidatus Sulfotelmatobacter kueseliae]